MTWITPLLHDMSAALTLALPAITVLSSFVTVNVLPSRVVTSCVAAKSAIMTLLPESTWYFRMSTRSARAGNSALVTPKLSSRAMKAASVGANTVNGPAPFKASTNPAVWSASTSTVKLPALIAVSTVSGMTGGRSTESMTWITPLLHDMSAALTLALPAITVLSSFVTVNVLPSRVVTPCVADKSALMTLLPESTWYFRMSARSSRASNSALVTPKLSSRATKAASVGANTVNGPAPFKASTNPAGWSASTRTVKLPALIAVSTMSGMTGGRSTESMTWITPLLHDMP